ncbi:integrase catalytic domain-containing protein [Trichonephila clavipes]|nr:integrase catalytic domain-containing protein [Trichonephila clavipes]
MFWLIKLALLKFSYRQTLVVMLQNGNHKSLVRALIDTGSQKSYILKSTAENLGFKYEGEEFVHSLFGGSKTKMYRHKCYNICLTDIDNYYTCNLNVYDQEIICNDVPSIRHGPWINELKNRKSNLSDSGHKLGGKIEILLGADVAGKLLTGTMFYLKSGPVAIKTKLGWTLMGKTYRNETKFDKNHFMNVTSMFVNDMCISDLWKLDSLGITDPVETKTKLEIQKETLNHFQKPISVDISGRYEVALLWVLDNKLLSSNRKLAENRLESTKRKLIATGKFKEYQDVLDLWLSEKIIEEVNDDKENFVHYLPHRPVIIENSTSKIRPVFDASARTKGSSSLNDCLEKGPNLIEVIPTILNRFRKYKIGVISDIEKAFLQIGVREQDRFFEDFLRFIYVLVYLRGREGPSWLSESPVQCPRSKQVPDEEAVNLELRKSVLVNTSNGRILNRGLSSSYPRTGGNSQIGETSLFSTADRAKSSDYSSKDNPRILPADFGG